MFQNKGARPHVAMVVLHSTGMESRNDNSQAGVFGALRRYANVDIMESNVEAP